MLWHCTRCGEGFHFKSNKSKHRNACLNKNGPEIYQPRAPFDEKLEETFKPKTAIPVSIPPQAQPDPQPKPEDKPEDQPKDQPKDQPEDQPEEQFVVDDDDNQRKTEAAVSSISGEGLLNMLSRGQIPGGTLEDDDDEPENVVKKEHLDIEMKFDD